MLLNLFKVFYLNYWKTILHQILFLQSYGKVIIKDIATYHFS